MARCLERPLAIGNDAAVHDDPVPESRRVTEPDILSAQTAVVLQPMGRVHRIGGASTSIQRSNHPLAYHPAVGHSALRLKRRRGEARYIQHPIDHPDARSGQADERRSCHSRLATFEQTVAGAVPSGCRSEPREGSQPLKARRELRGRTTWLRSLTPFGTIRRSSDPRPTIYDSRPSTKNEISGSKDCRIRGRTSHAARSHQSFNPSIRQSFRAQPPAPGRFPRCRTVSCRSGSCARRPRGCCRIPLDC